jgi:L-ribulose-5-phosphate 3-epimerase
VGKRIQAFPERHWRDEFALAERYGFPLIEWTLDHNSLNENPLMNPGGREEIMALSARHGVDLQSISGDCFMQAPFFKTSGALAAGLHDELCRVIEAAAEIGFRYIVVPLVDSGHIETPEQADRLHNGLEKVVPALQGGGVKILFESDFGPEALKRFIDDYPAACFGLNYDIGNSASLGHEPGYEIAAYGERIDNVHVKDRLRSGTTVPLGEGAADLPRTIHLLRHARYRGDFILQTARARDGEHHIALCRYRDMVRGWLADED